MPSGVQDFRPGRALTAQAALALAVVLVLAAWQFSRGMEKSALASERAERLRALPVPSAVLGPQTPDFTRVELGGTYDTEREFFVAGRLNAGVEAWSVLNAADGAFLVNRGRLAKPTPPPAGSVAVVGVLWPTAKATAYAAEQPWPEGWPKRVRWADPLRMADAVGALAREIRLERGSAGVTRPASLAWDYSPGTHWGYTVQWLLIGAAIVLGYVVIGVRKGRRDDG